MGGDFILYKLLNTYEEENIFVKVFCRECTEAEQKLDDISKIRIIENKADYFNKLSDKTFLKRRK